MLQDVENGTTPPLEKIGYDVMNEFRCIEKVTETWTKNKLDS